MVKAPEASMPPQIQTETLNLMPAEALEEIVKLPRHVVKTAHPSWTHTEPTIDFSLTSMDKHEEPLRMKNEFKIRVEEKYKHHRIVYTDGSHDPSNHRTGAGIHFPALRDAVIPLSPYSSIFTAELAAIQMAIGWIKLAEKKKPTSRKYLIATDSLSSLLALKNQSSERLDYVHGILQAITNCALKGTQIDLIWIPSHIDIKGNEIADSLAKLATQPNSVGNIKRNYIKHPQKNSLSPGELTAIVKQTLYSEWKDTLLTDMAGPRKHYDRAPSAKLVKIPGTRKQQARLYRIRLGGECIKFQEFICGCGETSPSPLSTFW